MFDTQYVAVVDGKYISNRSYKTIDDALKSAMENLKYSIDSENGVLSIPKEWNGLFPTERYISGFSAKRYHVLEHCCDFLNMEDYVVDHYINIQRWYVEK